MNIKNQFLSIEQMSNQLKPNVRKDIKVQNQNSKSFTEILSEKKSIKLEKELIFSKHANERLASRDIELTNSQLQRLENGTNLAGRKGIKESLVMVDDIAFIVNIKEKTVITAVKDGNDKVFTNIDGAIIV